MSGSLYSEDVGDSKLIINKEGWLVPPNNSNELANCFEDESRKKLLFEKGFASKEELNPYMVLIL